MLTIKYEILVPLTQPRAHCPVGGGSGSDHRGQLRCQNAALSVPSCPNHIIPYRMSHHAITSVHNRVSNTSHNRWHPGPLTHQHVYQRRWYWSSQTHQHISWNKHESYMQSYGINSAQNEFIQSMYYEVRETSVMENPSMWISANNFLLNNKAYSSIHLTVKNQRRKQHNN